jgi:integrase
MFTAISRQHETMGRPVTTATLVRIKATLRTSLNAAVRAGHVATNAASRAELPPARRPKAVVWTAERISEWQRTGVRPPVAVWTPAQTATFLNGIRHHRLYAAYHLIALRGLRRGEACGLRWCDIDLDSGAAIIAQPRPPRPADRNQIPAADRATCDGRWPEGSARRSGNAEVQACGHTLANLRPYHHASAGMRNSKTPGQNGCAARDLNPEPAD